MSAIFHRYDQGRRNLGGRGHNCPFASFGRIRSITRLPFASKDLVLLIAQSYFHTFRQLYK